MAFLLPNPSLSGGKPLLRVGTGVGEKRLRYHNLVACFWTREMG